MLHPEWDGDRVAAEVERIEGAAADPDGFDGSFGGGGDPAGGGAVDDETDPDAEPLE
jgi:hypothetical protein